jgi:hypothetical protein
MLLLLLTLLGLCLVLKHLHDGGKAGVPRWSETQNHFYIRGLTLAVFFCTLYLIFTFFMIDQ